MTFSGHYYFLNVHRMSDATHLYLAFYGCKMVTLDEKCNKFLFAQNINCGARWNRLIEAVLTSANSPCFQQ